MPSMTPTPRSRLKRAALRTGTILGTLAVAGLAVGLVGFGSDTITRRAEAVVSPDPVAPMPVQVRTVAFDTGYDIPRSFAGQIEPRQEIGLSFELAGLISEVLFDEGDQVSAGDIVARLDTRTLQNSRDQQVAARDALTAQVELARLTTDRQRALNERGFSSSQRLDEERLRLAELTARIAEIDMAIAGIDIQIDKSVVRAPFGGTLGQRQSDPGAVVSAGQPVAALLQNGTPEMRVGLTPAAAEAVAIGDKLQARFGPKTFAATLIALRPDVDPATRTRTALFRIDTADGPLPAYGETGAVIINERVDMAGAWIDLAGLREGTRGLWSILTYDAATQTIAQEAVEILHADGTRAYVRGSLRDGAQIIAQGPHRLTVGQRVSLIEE